MDALTDALTYGFAAVLLVAAAVTLVWSRRLSTAVGPVLHRELPRRGGRLPLLAGVALTGLQVVAGGLGVPIAPALLVLAGVALILALSPGFSDSVYGERGVRCGWHARRFEQLEEWRLTGEHLRWKLFGEWVASRVPPADQPALRERLEQSCPGRESRFSA